MGLNWWLNYTDVCRKGSGYGTHCQGCVTAIWSWVRARCLLPLFLSFITFWPVAHRGITTGMHWKIAWAIVCGHIHLVHSSKFHLMVIQLVHLPFPIRIHHLRVLGLAFFIKDIEIFPPAQLLVLHIVMVASRIMIPKASKQVWVGMLRMMGRGFGRAWCSGEEVCLKTECLTALWRGGGGLVILAFLLE